MLTKTDKTNEQTKEEIYLSGIHGIVGLQDIINLHTYFWYQELTECPICKESLVWQPQKQGATKYELVADHPCQSQGINYFMINGMPVCGYCNKPMVKNVE